MKLLVRCSLSCNAFSHDNAVPISIMGEPVPFPLCFSPDSRPAILRNSSSPFSSPPAPEMAEKRLPGSAFSPRKAFQPLSPNRVLSFSVGSIRPHSPVGNGHYPSPKRTASSPIFSPSRGAAFRPAKGPGASNHENLPENLRSLLCPENISDMPRLSLAQEDSTDRGWNAIVRDNSDMGRSLFSKAEAFISRSE